MTSIDAAPGVTPNAMAQAECWELKIIGRVQGVGYRGSARYEADRLGLHGRAHNIADGSVEVIAEGDPAALAAFEAWCRRGPPFAHVIDVIVVRLAALRGFQSFDIG